MPGACSARRRISAGSGIAESVYARIAELTQGFLRSADGQALGERAMAIQHDLDSTITMVLDECTMFRQVHLDK